MIKLKSLFEHDNKILQQEFVEGFDMKEFLALPTYAKKIKYAGERLRRLASGSSRTVYTIDNAKVLKLAKNVKGLAQNEAEGDWGLNQMYGDIIAKVLDRDEEWRWIVSEYAKPVTKTRFKHLVGVDIYIFFRYLRDELDGINSYVSPEDKKILDENEFFGELMGLIRDFDMEIGDFGRGSSFGELDGRIVIIDYGLTKTVFNTHYARR